MAEGMALFRRKGETEFLWAIKYFEKYVNLVYIIYWNKKGMYFKIYHRNRCELNNS